MPRCTRKGCSKEYDQEKNEEGDCRYHPGGPVFHEGLKSWSCCNETSKPVMEFEAFMAIPPCAQGKHTTEQPTQATPSSSSQTAAPTFVNQDGSETYGVTPKPPTSIPTSSTVSPTPAPATTAKEVEEDDPNTPVPPGAQCKRLGCKVSWEGEEVSRGQGEEAKCKHHPQAPVFHEGSKGYLCCKRRVLEFDEFMKIEGCTVGNHLFVGAKKDESKEEIVSCRLDHYQTPTQVHVSAFAKGLYIPWFSIQPDAIPRMDADSSADKERSSVKFESQQLHLDIYLPGNKRVNKSFTLYGPIDPSACTFRILSTKVDIVLTKPGPASWPLLELPPAGSELPPGYALTFGVTGRTGSVGGKEIVLAPEEMAKRG